jgi:hypothetical protein
MIKHILSQLPLFILFISTVLFVAHAQYDNGRIAMCEEVGGNMTTDGMCIDSGTLETILESDKPIWHIPDEPRW